MRPTDPIRAARRVRRHRRRGEQQRSRALPPATAATPQPCPYRGGELCRLDGRRHYHHVHCPSGAIETVILGSERDVQIRAADALFFDDRATAYPAGHMPSPSNYSPAEYTHTLNPVGGHGAQLR